MLPIIGAEMLVQDRRRDVADAAAHDQLVRACRSAHPRPGRGRLGRLLVRAGVRLAHGDVDLVLVAAGGSPVRIVRTQPQPTMIGAPLDLVVR
jgi:hypothetical protein